ncbi:Hypothetical protein GbCGDNIH2_7027 [Granulibacter bethesdensis]|uniref:Uncharacterized protein n=1 Tax=Granulibacter bethesdensis (strain ATCC BAA-1260 / CGDNIH1) TaxID=391165 RepID=A0A286M2W3_GRABC|nr:Hypothetical protein GbCGDNIH2_7027 [Granulibacter bethesdensis]APH51077.1 Hypothetical protein GbCGDNIH5_7027 [Granulibacter bethesdensis]APH63771.1 Hypothetical protein GbCGDNIH1I4_7027 [Granulibacter bethesdensis]ASV62362.1 Hypothetical protein GbCGDNIH1_7027 [Granulibacter bethesdensis CGDNIH1]
MKIQRIGLIIFFKILADTDVTFRQLDNLPSHYKVETIEHHMNTDRFQVRYVDRQYKKINLP